MSCVFVIFVLFWSTTSLALAGCWARTSSCRLSSRRCFPPGDFDVFWLFLPASSGAFLVSLWVGGVPLAAFSLPLCLRALLLSGLVGSPCRVFPVFSPCFLGGRGVVFSLLFSCYLLLLASSLARRLGLRKHGLPTRKPPGPHRACT